MMRADWSSLACASRSFARARAREGEPDAGGGWGRALKSKPLKCRWLDC